MGDPDILQRNLILTIEPAIVLLKCLKDMMELANWATLVVRGSNIQISTSTPNRSSYAMLETVSGVTYGSWSTNGYALHVDLHNWFQLLSNPILQQPASLLCIRKLSASTNLECVLENNQPVIDVGAAEFVQRNGVDMNSFDCRISVATRTEWCSEAIQAFALPDDEVQLVISITTSLVYNISWVAPSSGSHMTFSAELKQLASSSLTENDVVLQLKWNWPFYQMISSGVSGYERVEVSTLVDGQGFYWYHFRFLHSIHSNTFCYMEKGPSRVSSS